MPFNSYQFLIFLPIAFALYWFVFKKRPVQNVFIVVASYVFYGWWDWRFLSLIAFTTLCCYFSGILIGRYLASGEKKKAKAVNVCNIVINIAVLGYFKYFNFFIDSLVSAASLVGWKIDVPTANIILPVGISFYTFQAIGYPIDVKRKVVPACRDIVSFFAFVSFFPQLVAGPIERAKNLLPQFSKERTFNYEQATDGLWQMLWGFFKKLVIADNCAKFADTLFLSPSDFGAFDLSFGLILFFFQIYCDFSGYSDIAIGTAKLFGFKLSPNFNSPEYSRNIAEFWRKWHISLNGWFFDYVFFAMKGWGKKWRVVLNVLVVFLLSGLWHGADVKFICWGLYFGILSVPHFVKFKPLVPAEVASGGIKPSFKEVRQMIVTFILVLIAGPLFRCASMADAMEYYRMMFVNFYVAPSHHIRPSVYGFILILMVLDWFFRGKPHPFQFGGKWSGIGRIAVFLCVMFLIFWFSCSSKNFIYFNF